MNSTGMACVAQSTTFCEVTSLHFNGAVGQQEKTASGLSARLSRVPRTASWSSFMMLKASMVNAPVTTGFSPYMRLR
ncbi:MAG: hypothetical protein ACYTAQ_02250 [Planctomycetota bacterium]|jgi:hypothetical protein